MAGKPLCRSNFNVYKLIGWDPVKFIQSKSAVEKLEKGGKYVPVEALEKCVKYVQSSGVFIINFEHISDLFLLFLLFTMNR